MKKREENKKNSFFSYPECSSKFATQWQIYEKKL